MGLQGTMFQWVLPNAPEIANPFLLCVQFLSMMAGTRFSSRFLQIQERNPRFHQFMEIVTILGFVGAGACWFVPEGGSGGREKHSPTNAREFLERCGRKALRLREPHLRAAPALRAAVAGLRLGDMPP